MKNILITGMTPKQVGRSTSSWVTFVDALKTILSSDILKQYMRETINVEHRNVIPGEDLSRYDKVIVFISVHDSIAAGYRWSGLWALAARPDAIVAVDDWQYFIIQNKLNSAIRAGRFFRFVDKFPDRSKKEEVISIINNPYVRNSIMNVAKSMCEDIPFKHVLMPLFPWCDKKKIGFKISDMSKIIPIDPSRFVNLPDIITDCKEKQWVMGSLFDHSKYIEGMKPTWPVLKYGHRKTQKVLTETELCVEYSKSYGIISPKYRTAGDGWWRMRYVHAAKYNCLLHMSREESINMPTYFHYPLKQVESFNTTDLNNVISFQNKWLWNNFEEAFSVVHKISEVLND